MGAFLKKFEKLGGMRLVKQYFKAGVLPTAVFDLLRYGTSQKGLELLRLDIQFQIYKKLKKKFGYILDEYKENADQEKKQSDKVWICWFQGMEKAPLLVQRCYHSLQKHLKDKEIILLTDDNMFDYVKFPEHILEKYRAGKISKTFLSDILRLELLIKYGGTWIDATVLCTSDEIPSCMFESDLFMYQILKPGRDGHSVIISSWFMSACSNNKVLITARDMIYAYWKKYNYLMDYGLLHLFVSMALEKYEDEWTKMPKFCNSVPHILLLEAFAPFDARRYEDIKAMSCFHKLTDKRDKELLEKKGTYYDMIINEGIEE